MGNSARRGGSPGRHFIARPPSFSHACPFILRRRRRLPTNPSDAPPSGPPFPILLRRLQQVGLPNAYLHSPRLRLVLECSMAARVAGASPSWD